MTGISRWTAIPAALQFEDLLLFIWLVLISPLLQFALAGALRGFSLDSIGPTSPNAAALGVIFLGSTLLAAACTLTRAPGDGNSKEIVSGGAFGYAHLPMLAATGIMIFLGLDFFGLGDAAMGLMCLWFGLFVAAGMIYGRMPVLDFPLRRALMTPFIILSTTVFTSSVNPALAGVDPSSLLHVIQSQLGRFEFGLILAAVLVYYLMFVFAPRQIAGSGGSWLHWAIRFALYLAGLILNVGFLQGV